MEPIAFTTKTEYKESLKLWLLRYAQPWRLWIIGIAWGLLLLESIFEDGTSKDLAVFILIFLVIVVLITLLRAILKIRKFYKTNPAAGMEVHWTISGAGVSLRQGTVASEVGWDRIDKVSDTKTWIMIWCNKKPFFYIQKRFLSPSQMNDFKKIVAQTYKGYFKY